MRVLFAMDQAADAVKVVQSSSSLMWLAIINVVSLATLAIIARWADSRKDRAQARAIAEAAVLAAKIKAEEKQLDWERQDDVAKRVEETARATAIAAAEAAKRQDMVAEQVQVAAQQAAAAAKLLVEQQEDARHRQDAVAERVQTAANQAEEAAKLLAAAQERMTAATEEVARLAAEADVRIQTHLRAIDEQGRKIHILVNSDMTAARTAERDALEELVLELMKTNANTERIKKLQRRIEELNQILADRQAAQKIVEAEAHASGTSPAPPTISQDGKKQQDQSALQNDRDSRHSPTIISDGSRELKEIALNTRETAKNTADAVKNTADAVKNTADAVKNTADAMKNDSETKGTKGDS